MQANQSDGPNCGIALLNSVIVMHTQRKLSPPLERRLSACAQPMPCHVCPLRYIWFSQESTGEKNLARDIPPLWFRTAGRIDGGSANSRSVQLGPTDELALGPHARGPRLTAGF
jgi:hypothetical protein